MRFYNIISLVPNKIDECADDLRRLKTDCGMDTFAAFTPFHPQGAPLMQKTEEFMERYRTLRDAVAHDGIHGGILIQSLINHGDRGQSNKNVPFQGITGSDGTTCKNCFCPMDKDFQDYTQEMITLMSKENPEFLLLDDDFRMSNHRPVSEGCFCDLHMNAFNTRFGHNMSREELGAILDSDDDQAEIRKQWDDILRDGLLEMCHVIRAAIDAVNPDIRGGICMTNTEFDHSVDMINALSGTVRPLVRIANANYMESALHDSSGVLTRAIRWRRYVPENAEIICEGDTCPHHLYSTSATGLRHQIAASLIGGVEGTKLWITDTRNGETGSGENYRRMLTESRGLFDTLCDFSKTIEWSGPSIAYPSLAAHHFPKPTEDNPHGDNGGAWGAALAHLGIAHIEIDDAPVRMMSGNGPAHFDKETLNSFFSAGLLLDGAAAKLLCNMGFSELMGVSVENDKISYANEFFDPANSANGTAAGKRHAHGHNFEHKRLTPLDESVQIASRYMDSPWFQASEETYMAPAVTLYQNKLGGRVAVFARPVPCLGHGGFDYLNPRRRAQLTGILDWLNESPLPHAVHEQRCTMRYGRIRDTEQHAVVFINYTQDPISPLVMQLPGAETLSKAEKLGNDGQWHSVDFENLSDNQIAFKLQADLRDVVVLRISEDE